MGTISIEVRQNDDFINSFNKLKEEYGEDFQILNGLHKSQLDFSTFIDGFVDKNTVADATIDGDCLHRCADFPRYVSHAEDHG